ncbi:hypothetical protein [Lentisalinibacter orientalis]|uniref:hypothetical protein n=1 Tax=Lentisalinibacter orientalis TaxID=2992241 RepID=UPI003865ECCC
METQETPGSRGIDHPAEAPQETPAGAPAMSRTEKLFVRVSVWLRDSRDEAADPRRVEACPDFGEAGFRY